MTAYVQTGTGSHVVNDEQNILRSGSVLFINAEDHHLFENVDDLCLTNVLYKRNDLHFRPRLDPAGKEHKSLQLGFSSMSHVDVLTENLLRESRANDHFSRHMSEALLSQLMITILRGSLIDPTDLKEKEDRFFAILKYISENYSQPIDIEELADTYQIPLRTLHRMMKSYVGLTPGRYLNKIRILSAMHLLQRESIPVTDIAYKVGFNDSNYFSVKFKEATGVKPSDFRVSS